jgi:hypothetical protein
MAEQATLAHFTVIVISMLKHGDEMSELQNHCRHGGKMTYPQKHCRQYGRGAQIFEKWELPQNSGSQEDNMKQVPN